MRLYELTYLISPDISENELKESSQKIKDFIVKENGNIQQETEPVKQKLGYPIKKKGEAFLVTLNFRLEPANLEKLEKILKNENQILRYIILAKQPPKKIIEKPPRKPLVKIPRLEIPTKAEGIPETKKIELKEIDKKIEEILNE